MKIEIKKYKNMDWVLLLSACGIFVLGLLFLFSATYPNNIDYAVRQIIWFLIGALFFLFIVNFNYRKIVGVSSVFYSVTVLSLLAVLMFGASRYGAQRWLSVAGLTIQPSEFAKLFVTLFLVQYLSQHKSQKSIGTIMTALALTLIPFIFIIKEPDLGTALMLLPVVFIVLFAWGAPIRYLVSMLLSAIVLSPLGWFFLKDYQKERLLVFLNPGIDPLGAGYTIIQSRIAIGSGGVTGKGWMAGTQNQLNFLAERHTDFIFSVAGEEWGFSGAMVLLMLYFVFLMRALKIAEKTVDPCGKLLAVGLTVMIGVQVVVNMSMTMGFMPVVGLPLPLVSYGGSSLLVNIFAIALLESIAIHE